MATEKEKIDQAWLELVFAEEADRESQMRKRYQELATLSEQDRLARLILMVRAEFALQDDKLRRFTRSSIRVWLDLPPEDAKKVIASYETALGHLPKDKSVRRVTTVQTLTHSLTPQENAKARLLMPDVFTTEQDAASVSKPETPAAPSGTPEEKPKKKGRWPF